MQPFAGLPDPLGQQGLHVHVDVLRVHHPLDLPGLRVGQDVLQAGHDLFRVRLRDDALFAQHRGMGNGPGDILLE